VTILIATHDLDLVSQLGHRRIQLVSGHVAGDSAA
jgi:ABC-type ATPase involved in cell division